MNSGHTYVVSVGSGYRLNAAGVFCNSLSVVHITGCLARGQTNTSDNITRTTSDVIRYHR